MGFQKHSTWVEIDLKAIETNVRHIVRVTGVDVMAVVKANGYGHGAMEAAKAALQGGATWCGVARIEEAIKLRQSGVTCPILVMGFTSRGMLPEAISYGISITAWSRSQIDHAAELAQQTVSGQDDRARIHLKIDSGMGRLGAPEETAIGVARHIEQTPNVMFEGIFTHFARADEADTTPSDLQEERFRGILNALKQHGIQPRFVHAANSAASLKRPSAHFNMVRLGIAMYGLQPSASCPTPAEMRPALTWKSCLSQIKTLPPGSGVSYGHEYITRGHEKIGTIPVGYADGYRRIEGNIVLIRGKRIPVIGRVCMDQIMVQLDQALEAQEGDEVVLIGNQGTERISVEEIAQRWGTINYEVVCGIASRVPREYREGCA